MNTNGWLVSPSFAKWIIGTVFAVGMWVSTIQLTLGDKADKIDVATQVATQTEVLKGIARSLESIDRAVKSLDAAQRTMETDVAVLKAESDTKDD